MPGSGQLDERLATGRSPLSRSAGFSLIELIIAMVVAGLLAGLGYANLNGRLERERLQSSSRVLVAWLEDRRRQGMVSMEQVGTGACAITVDTAAASFSAASATVRPASSGEPKPPPNICLNPAPLNLRQDVPDSNTRDLKLTMVPSTPNQVLFSFRGTSPTAAEFKLTLGDGPEARCVLLTAPLGLIRLGVARPATANCLYSRTLAS